MVRRVPPMTDYCSRAFIVAVAMALAVGLLAMAGPLARAGNAQQAADPPPPTLTGESLVAYTITGEFYGPDEGLGEFTVTSVSCSESEGEGTLTYTARGPAAGPYPGTYEETGTFELGDPTVFGPRVVESFEATFEIDAVIDDEPYTVTGTKRAPVSSLEYPYGECFTDGDDSGEREEVFLAIAGTATTSYEATIETPSGSRFRDSGNARVGLTSQRYFSSSGTLDGEFANFDEFFYSGLSETEPILPTTTEGCKNYAWKAYGVFENQGDCVSFVQTQGKNEPGKNQHQ